MHIKDFDPYEFSKTEASGIDVYHKNLPWAPCIHIYFTFSVGAFSDPVGKEGLAHFLEHMVGNGSPLLPDKKAIKEFSRIYMLNSQNAFTGHYQSAYIGKCLPEHFPKVLEAMKDYVFHPYLRPEDAEHERKVITEEAWSRYKNAKFLAYAKEVSTNQFHGHERSRIASPLGWPDTVQKIDTDDLSRFHKETYIKENLTVFLVGAVEDEHLALLTKALADIPSGEKATLHPGTIEKPLESRFERQGADIGHMSEQASFVISRALSRAIDEEEMVGSQAQTFLKDALYERLRIEQSLCYGVSVGISAYRDYEIIGISVDTSRDKIETVEKEVWNVIREIKEGVWEKRFEGIHALALDQMRSKERLSGNIIEESSDEFVVRGRIIPLKEMLKKAEAVTYDKVREFITRMFDPEFVFTEIILPGEKK